MTDNEIIKALECCKKATMKADCEKLGCPMFQKGWCAYVAHSDLNGDADEDVVLEGLATDALDLINRQKAEKEALIAGQETLQRHIAEQKAEIERLRAEADKEHRYCNHYVKMIAKSNAKAITGFAIELKEEFYFDEKIPTELCQYLKERIDYLVKEMVGDNNA